MKKYVANDFIRQLVVSSDIVSIISKYVKLKKMGKSFMACCPFHNEKTPSFSVSAEKQIYHCFSCHSSGDIIDFLVNYNNLTFIDAVEELAYLQGITVVYSVANDNTESVSETLNHLILDVLKISSRYYKWCLHFDANRQVAVNYVKSRGITAKIANFFQIGYAPNEWKSLYKVLKKKYSYDILNKAGLVAFTDKGDIYDRFRGRLIFPIKNRQGLVIGFGGRTFSDKKSVPKYLNSPESAVFFKSQELYGLYELIQKHKRPSHILVVEGYMDVISLHQYGYTMAVATLGTALSITQINTLFRYTSEIILCFDGDVAGKNAAFTSLKILLPLLSNHKRARFLLLPKQHDPDSFIKREGVENFKIQINRARNASDFFIESLLNKYDISSVDNLAQLVEEVKASLHGVSAENIYLTMIIERLAKAIDISPLQLNRIVTTTNLHDKNTTVRKKIHYKKNSLNLTDKALIYMLNIPKEAHRYLQGISEIQFKYVTDQQLIFFDALNIIKNGGSFSSVELIQMLVAKHPKLKSYLYRLLQIPIELNTMELTSELMGTLNKIIKQSSHNELENLILKAKTSILTKAEKQRMHAILCESKENIAVTGEIKRF